MDIEAELVRILNDETDIPWSTVRPEGDFPCGTVERVGGGARNHVESPMVAFQVWGETRAQAAAMAAELVPLICGLVNNGRIRGASVESVCNFPDFDGGRPRYQITATFRTAGA